jgi:hypothetical protein
LMTAALALERSEGEARDVSLERKPTTAPSPSWAFLERFGVARNREV